MTKHINLTLISENVQYHVGDTELTVERENEIWNYFFFSTTSIDFDSSTMALDFEDISGWEPNGCLVSCNGFESVYAIKVIIPKFWYLEGESDTRTISVYGRIQTTSSSVGSDYSISIRTRGCQEGILYTLSYETYDNDRNRPLEGSSGNFNVESIIRRNISFFDASSPEKGEEEAKMYEVVARKEWEHQDSDYSTYSTSSYSEEQIGCNSDNSQINNRNYITLGSGFFSGENEFTRVDHRRVAYDDSNSKHMVHLMFGEPITAIGYHTFYLGLHVNGEDIPDADSNEGKYISYEDSSENFNYIPGTSGRTTTGDEGAFYDGKISCSYPTGEYYDNPDEWEVKWETKCKNQDPLDNFCAYINEDVNGAKRATYKVGSKAASEPQWRNYTLVNQNEWLFDESNNIKGIKTGGSLQTIGNQAFKRLKKLQYIDFEGSSVKKIGRFAFEGCSMLSAITLPSTVVSIGEGAFKRSGVTGLTIPSGVEYIGQETFRLCRKLQSLTFAPNSSLKKIGPNAFRGCDNSSLTSITLPSSLERIERRAFGNCKYLKNVTFNSQVYIGDYAFSCAGITALTVSAITINKNSFRSCSGLKQIELKNTTSIEESAFRYCSAITSVKLPTTLTNIGEYAFCGCSSLTRISYAGSTDDWGSVSLGYKWRADSGIRYIVCSNGTIDLNN